MDDLSAGGEEGLKFPPALDVSKLSNSIFFLKDDSAGSPSASSPEATPVNIIPYSLIGVEPG